MLSPPSRRRAAADVLAAAALLALSWALYHRAAGLWWSHDDLFQLRYLLTWSPGQYALDPEVWRRLPFKMLTPLLFLSLDLDLSLFGLSPRGFYLHQILAVGLCAVALHAVLRLWLQPLWSFAGAFLFLISPPVASLAPLLMVRHYPEAILFLLLAVWGYVRAVRSGRIGWAVLAAVFYLAAMLAKEIAVPLVLLLPLIPEGGLRTRLRCALPPAVALALYLAWRVHMLGTLLGGYGWVVAPGDWPGLALALPGKIGRELLGAPSVAGWLTALILLAGLLLLAARGARAAVLVFAAALLAILPVLPVSTEMAPRYAVLPALGIAAAFAFGGAWAERFRGVLLLAACGGGLLVNREVWAGTLERLERMSAENRFFLEMGPGDLLRLPLGPPASMGELQWYKQEKLGRAGGSGWFFDDLYLCSGAAEGRRVFGWDPAARRVVDVTAEMPARRRAHCSAVRWNAPLSVRFTGGGPAVLWDLGSYREGRYSLVFGDGIQAFEVPRQGGFQVRNARRLVLRVRYEAPEGWVTYSPELAVDFTKGEFRWER
jgi:hypothetical protein